ncbi:MAG: hypothetical protein DMG35_19055 [Acidobacteria bacterium]|nr:MAG: hypothetical protein DMG35_19055 [Acidobacteriota bacterium]
MEGARSRCPCLPGISKDCLAPSLYCRQFCCGERRKSRVEPLRAGRSRPVVEGIGRDTGIFVVACMCGVASGMFGIGGGVLLVPLLGLLFSFSQHRAQGTSLVAMIPPTGALALMAYARQGFVSWRTGLLLIPGVFLGGIVGGILAKNIQPRRMRQVFAGILFALGAWQAASAWWR